MQCTPKAQLTRVLGFNALANRLRHPARALDASTIYPKPYQDDVMEQLATRHAQAVALRES